MRPILNRSGKGGGQAALWTVVALLVVIAGIGAFMVFGGTQQQEITTGGQTVSTKAGTTSCPDNLAWAGTADVVNKLNATGTETYDTTAYVYVANADGTRGSLKTSITDTTAGTLSLTCGENYIVDVLSTDGNAGDSAEILSASEGKVIDDGALMFTAKGAGNRITLNMNQRGLYQVRAKDQVTGAFMYPSTSASNTGYLTTDGVTFMSSTDNVTNTAVGAGGKLHVTEYVQAANTDNDLNDLGMWVLVDADPTVWDIDHAAAKLDGSSTPDAKGSLNPDEKIAFNTYELAFKVPASRVIDNNNELEFDLTLSALGGINPTGSNNITIEYAPIGKYLSSKDSNVLKVGAVDDSSSRARVYTGETTNIAVS